MEKVYSIHINNLPSSTTEEQLKEAFSTYGDVVSVRLLLTNSGECRGYAFLDYQTDEEMNKAISEANDSEFHGNRIKVEKTRHPLGDPPRQKRSGPRGPGDFRYRDGPRRFRDDSPEQRRYRGDASRYRYRDDSPPYRRAQQYYNDSSLPRRIVDDSPPPRRIVDDSPPPSTATTRRTRDERSPPSRRIVDDSPPPRRIVDDSPPPRRIVDDSPPPRRIRDDDDTPPRKYYMDDSPPPRRTFED